MALSVELFDAELKKTIKKISENPEDDEKYRMEFVSFVSAFVGERVQRAKEDILATMCINLYDGDYKSLRRDLAKIVMLGGQKTASVKERMELLKGLLGSIDIYLKGDYTAILNPVCNTIIFNETMEPDEDELPFC